jgi:hypothetical protein
MGEMDMKKILSVGLIGAFGFHISCMQLEYIENTVADEEIAIQDTSSTNSSASSELQIGKHELARKGISYYEAILICNEMSLAEGLDTLYQYETPIFTEDSLFWLPNIKVLEENSGYRLPTKEEWLKAQENGEIEKLYENVGEWLYGETNSQYSIYELAPHFLKAVGLYRGRDGYPVYGIRVVRQMTKL